MRVSRGITSAVSASARDWASRARDHHLKSALIVLVLGLAMLANAPVSAGADERQGGCANESLRATLGLTSLPDCRAYEMVSPPYKEGYPMFVRSLASNGNSAILESLATLAGNPGSSLAIPEAAIYNATRTATGWQLSPLNPPLAAFVGQILIEAEADGGETLWEQHTPQQPASLVGLYKRSASGQFNFIGRLSPLENPLPEEDESSVLFTPLSTFDFPVAMTHDYTHVVLEAHFSGAIWPSDHTEGPERLHSLYEYSGIQNNGEPTLVAVNGPKGSHELIGKCGTTLGAGFARASLDAYNALSSDGETIFFTVAPCGSAPTTAELYARLHGASTSAVPAETAHISESECSVACGESESGKDFEGASEDGKRVFFTSTQRLTNDAVNGTESGDAAEITGRGCAQINAGKLGCNLYEYDFNRPQTERLRAVSVGGEVLGVAGVAEDGSRVYFVSRAAIPSTQESPYGKLPVAASPNLYVFDVTSGVTTLIATLGSQDERDWMREFRRSAETAGAGGQFLLFASSVPNVTPDDTSTQTQLYEYKAASHPGAAHGESAELVRVTKGEGGFNADGNGVSVGVSPGSIGSVAQLLGFQRDFKSTTNKLNVAVDGQTVFFETAGMLSPRATSATNGCTSLYVFHPRDGRLIQGVVGLVSDGQDVQLYKGFTCGAQLQYIDHLGENALFSTADPLLPGDVDSVQRDIYDARTGGGFIPASRAGTCDSGSCEGMSSAPPVLPVAGSAEAEAETVITKTVTTRAGRGRLLARALERCKGKLRARRERCKRTTRKRIASKAKVSVKRGDKR